MPGQAPDPPAIGADNPIRKPEDDVLGRTKFARCFAEQALSLDDRGLGRSVGRTFSRVSLGSAALELRDIGMT